MTEPDCLGPCEPGTSVTLEGIVWHETEGVLVVNVTWRGKTYVGTLLDCTRHDWAPPRFCDSPTSDLDARLPKSRAKRGRAATNDLSNFTETRSSVHSKLRSSSNGSNKGGARKGLSNSPTPFVSPRPESGGSSSNKRKSRPSEDESSASPQANGKKRSSQTSAVTSISPPSSPIFFECPEANCCKKYKHINGLKYHQSHAHGNSCAGDDDDTTKESGSMSENEEMPSPADPQSMMKCGERGVKDENSESEPATPISAESAVSSSGGTTGSLNSMTPSSPVVGVPISLAEMEPVAVERSPPPVDNKTVVKPGVLRYGVVPAAIDEMNSSSTSAKLATTPPSTAVSTNSLRPIPSNVPTNTLPPLTLNSSTTSQSTSPSPPSIPQPIPLSPSAAPPSTLPHTFSAAQQLQPTTQSLPLNPTVGAKLPQFNVKPASVLMQEEKVKDKSSSKCQQQRKKSRKSPGGSPHAHPLDQSQYKVSENSGREDVCSPAYSDISDDGAPVLEPELADLKNKPLPMDKKTLESSGAHSPHAMQHFSMYSYYAQPPFLVPSVQPDAKSKEEKLGPDSGKMSDKEKKESELQQKLLPPHFYSYDTYVPNYGYNLSQNYPIPMVASSSEKDIKEESKSPGPTDLVKQPAPSSMHPSPNVGQYPMSMSASKSKMDQVPPKMSSEPYVSLKDGPESRSPLSASSPYLHSRPSPQQPPQQPLQQMQQMQPLQAHSQPPNIPHSQPQQMPPAMSQSHHLSQAHQQQQQHDEVRRFYGNSMYPEQSRRKESQHTSHSEAPLKATPPPNSVNSKSSMSMSSSKHKEKQLVDEKKDDNKVKQEGVKPTMETQGPPPPPTSSYAYFHSGYLQSPYVPFDPAHSMYRSMNPMIVPAGPYGNSPYLHHPAQMHPQITRYHAPEDLSRPPSGSASKALDLLHHQASQYYPSSHKIHELQERAIKSPTPKVSTTNASSAVAANGQPTSLSTAQLTPTSTSDRLSAGGSAQGGKVPGVDGKDSRSPPPQRHVHTHHHTHVGLGYPLLPGQYAPPYGAAVLASEQAAAVASAGSNPYSPK